MSLPAGNRSIRDNNRIPLLYAVSYLNPNQGVQVTADPATGAILTSAAGGSSTVTANQGTPNTNANAWPVSNTLLTQETGTWAYYAGSSGTVTVSAGQRVIGIAAHATTAGSMSINSGNSVPIPANVGLEWQPMGNLTAPTIVFTGTDLYVVEVVS